MLLYLSNVYFQQIPFYHDTFLMCSLRLGGPTSEEGPRFRTARQERLHLLIAAQEVLLTVTKQAPSKLILCKRPSFTEYRLPR